VPTDAPRDAPLLQIVDLHVSVDGAEILKGVDLEVGPGEVHALMGPNGPANRRSPPRSSGTRATK